MPLRLPEELREAVDEDKWGKDFDITNKEDLTPEVVEGYILHTMMWYKMRKYDDYQLWEYFREDFKGWTTNIFALGSTKTVRDLRDYLREYGVYIVKDGKAIAENLYDILQEEEYHQWTEQEVKHQLNTMKRLYSQWNPSTPEHHAQTGVAPVQTTQQTPTASSQNSTPQAPDQGSQQPSTHQIPRQAPEYTDHSARQLTDLMKIYNHDDKKFGGEMYDTLQTKLQIFYDCCNKVGLQRSDYENAYSVMLKGRAATFYYDKLSGRGYDFDTMLAHTRTHFETEENRQLYMSEWRETTLPRVIAENPTKTRLECLEAMFDKLQKIQRGLTQVYQTEYSLRDQVISACRGVPECSLALYKPASTYEGICAELRSAIGTAVRARESTSQQFNTHQDDYGINPGNQHDHNWTDRTYAGRRGYSQHRPRGNRGGSFRNDRQKKCYVCEKPNCWSTRHSLDERKEAYNKFRQRSRNVRNHEVTAAYFQTFLIQYEGVEDLDGDVNETEQLLMDMEIEEYSSDQYFTDFGAVDGTQTVAILNDQSMFHSVTKSDVFNEPRESSAFSFDQRYSENVFCGIMPDTGAADVSTAGKAQVRALQQLDSSVQVDYSTAGQHIIHFGKGSVISLGTITVQTPVGSITFQVVPTNTPFLFCIADMDTLRVKFDNLENVLIQGDTRVPIVRKWGHPWLLLHQLEKSVAWSHLTESELRQLHRRFGHPSVHRLLRVLQRAGHEVEVKLIEHLTKFCHYCQMNQKSPGRFKFNLKDDYEFNFSIVIDIMYLSGKPVLQVVDSSTSFQAARFLKDMSARNTWDTLRLCWIDVYLGPPDQIVHDAGKNFSSAEFRQQAKAMAIEVKEVPVEAHNSVGKVERYHTPLRRAYEIISSELHGASEQLVLQMAVKAVNDSAGPDGLVPTLLVFGAYPRMTDDSPPSPSIVQRAEAIRKAMKEIRHLYAKRQVDDALAMRNGPNTSMTLDLPLQSDVRVWREKGGWSGPHKLIATDGQTCTIQMPHGPTQFRSTVIKPYYKDDSPDPSRDTTEDSSPGDTTEDAPKDAPEESHDERVPDGDYDPDTIVVDVSQTQRGTGRPNGSHLVDFEEQFVTAIESGAELSMAFMTSKETADYELAKQLRKEGRITTPGPPFQASDKQEIDSLIARGVFRFEEYDPTKFGGVRIFKSRMVNEIKGKATDAPFEKSRLVIQGYNDDGKEVILTQSPTIQRASQRVIVALAPSLIKNGMAVYLRDITQAYTQSETHLQRLILAYLPEQIRHQYPEDTIMVVLKPLYGIAEAGTHWWATYSKHHKEKLLMTTSTFDPCFLITTTGTPFGIVGMQTDDTIILGDDQFSTLEEAELVKANLIAKPKQKLDLTTPLLFNGCIISLNEDCIVLRQKGQGNKIDIVNIDSPKQGYGEQRARGAYIASICQPEASFDLSVAAQHQEPTKDDVIALNKRLSWQMNHLDRGLLYVPIDLPTAKLFVFVDASFANNKDFSSQLGYEIIIANESTGENDFTIHGNLIHWSSTKSKRITRSVLASEIYGMVGGVDMAISIGTTLKIITDRLKLPVIPTIVCTDSYSLYECLVKLGTTKEKRLMIDIMALRQSYERRELFEIRWINGQDNPADALTKANPNKALETFVDTNTLRVRVEGWVKRE